MAPYPPMQSPAWWQVNARRYGVTVGGLDLLIPLGVESVVLNTMDLAAVPHAPREMLGVANVRDALVPVFDLSLLGGWPTQASHGNGPQEARTMVMIGKGPAAFALVVRGLPRPLAALVRADEAASPDLPEKLRAHVVAALRTADAQLWLEFDLVGLLHQRVVDHEALAAIA